MSLFFSYERDIQSLALVLVLTEGLFHSVYIDMLQWYSYAITNMEKEQLVVS